VLLGNLEKLYKTKMLPMLPLSYIKLYYASLCFNLVNLVVAVVTMFLIGGRGKNSVERGNKDPLLRNVITLKIKPIILFKIVVTRQHDYFLIN
jgi:hypothetical protein